MPTSTAGRSLLALTAALGLAIIAPHSALAAAGSHTTLADFQRNVRADVLLEPFNGPPDFVNDLQVSGNGYAYIVTETTGSTTTRNAFGIGANADNASTLFTFTGKPVTAFGGTLRRMDSNGVSIGGVMTIVTDTGESFTITAAVAGTFFGFTTTQPFSVVTYNTSVAGQGYEFIDDVYVGTSGTAVVAADQCDDAPVLTLIDSTVFPFTTVGATAQAIPGVCDSAIDTGPDVWFRFVATSTGSVTASTCGCDFDSILRVFGSCLIAGSGQHLACNDDFCTGGGVGFNRASQVQFRAEAGSDYLIRISGYNAASGSGTLTFSVVPDCRGDANHSGTLEVQDIFDFLNFWFAGCP